MMGGVIDFNSVACTNLVYNFLLFTNYLASAHADKNQIFIITFKLSWLSLNKTVGPLSCGLCGEVSDVSSSDEEKINVSQASVTTVDSEYYH